MMNKMKNAMTIDVEDYFQVSAFENKFNSSDWDDIAPRVEANTNRLLDLFAEKDAKATFFTLGWVAQRFPDLIKRIAREGHEVASHGTMHKRATDQSRSEFKADVGDAKRLLEDIVGEPVVGYRAPSFSFTKDNQWVYEVLSEEGYKYSSSIYPVVHDHYGIPDAPRFRYETESGVDEIPLSTLTVLGKNIPISGGGYFRLYPYMFSRYAIQLFKAKDQEPYIFYLHPWEVDAKQPRVEGVSAKTRFRHYINLKRVESRLSQLLTDFEWSSMADIYGYEG
ncbi:polysaccharide deacetylase [Gammaproteobacteria bacterium 45_16_T64]|nr:polysaccharide deacetylase [Gammaproteobacteria bacterium 45_16_T64]